MKPKVLIGLMVMLFAVWCLSILTRNTNPPVTLDDSHIIDQFEIEGIPVRLYDDGNLYRVDSGRLLGEYYDPVQYSNKYYGEDGKLLIRHEGNEQIPVRRQLEDGFETVNTFTDLISIASGWTTFTLQSPQTKTVAEYVALRACILAGTCDFKDNTIELSGRSHNGNTSLRFYAAEPTSDMTVSKTSIETGLLHFAKGDDLWFAGQFLVEEGMPLTIADFENEDFTGGPGPRLIFRDGYLSVELKGRHKPQYNQRQTPFPKGEWVEVVAHFKLSETDEGIIQVWQGGELIIDTTGPNLPTVNSILSRGEIGISATEEETLLYVDDVRISDQSLR